jgi:hypothetical protein
MASNIVNQYRCIGCTNIAFRALEIISFETRVLQVSLEFGLGPGRIRLQVMLVIGMRAQLHNWNVHSRR